MSTQRAGVRVQSWSLLLPRWDLAWEPRVRRGRLTTDRAGKPRRERKVWEALSGNARVGHWSARAKATREVHDAVILLARAKGLHRITDASFVDVRLVWGPGDHRRADALNLAPLVKAAADALARGRADLPGLHLVPDDTDRWMRQLPHIARPPHPAGLWLEVTVTRG